MKASENRNKWIDLAIQNNEGIISSDQALMVTTGAQTGRSTAERFVVKDLLTTETVDWGKVNQSIDKELADKLFDKVRATLLSQSHHELESYVGPFSLKVISPSAWHIAFAQNMFRQKPATPAGLDLSKAKQISIYHLPKTRAQDLGVDLKQWNTSSGVLIVLDPTNWRLFVVGTQYAGEIKKGAFSLCNYWLPDFGMLPMHASANCLEDGSASCVLFGLSGTGKTTLSASQDRYLIGDDEIIWNPKGGLFNLEGGCYAKLIDLDPAKEPDIYKAVNRYGAIMENVVYDKTTLRPDFSDKTLTENTRGSYSLEALTKVFAQEKEASSPRSIVFLTADAFGALPAVAKLDSDQAQYHFLSGYTAKVAGTEIGVKEPKAAFSACFGAPFMPRHPSVYAKMLAENASKCGASVWLLNTGWTGGSYASGAKRFPISVSRTLLSAIQNGSLDQVEMIKHPVFGFLVPKFLAAVEEKYLRIPEGEAVNNLAKRFIENAKGVFSNGPQLGGPRL